MAQKIYALSDLLASFASTSAACWPAACAPAAGSGVAAAARAASGAAVVGAGAEAGLRHEVQSERAEVTEPANAGGRVSRGGVEVRRCGGEVLVFSLVLSPAVSAKNKNPTLRMWGKNIIFAIAFGGNLKLLK